MSEMYRATRGQAGVVCSGRGMDLRRERGYEKGYAERSQRKGAVVSRDGLSTGDGAVILWTKPY